MERLKQFKYIAMLILAVMILVLFRATGADNFKPGAERLAAPSALRTNLISTDKMESLPGNKLIVLLSENIPAPENTKISAVVIPAPTILDKKNLKLIRKNNGPVLLYSDETATSAKVWMILSQLGLKDIYILTAGNEEVFKNEFRPDTLIRPEL
jgi:rhodanese-related sulfurtransferase